MGRSLGRADPGHAAACTACGETVTHADDGTWYIDPSDPATATCRRRHGGYHLVDGMETTPPLGGDGG